MGKVGNLEKTDDILRIAVEKIKNNDVETCRITKTVLVIDEAQDMNEDEFNLIIALMEQNEEMRVIAVGDDDQNIYEFRGASSKYLEQFIQVNKATTYELIENYRSKRNLVDFSNQFVKRIDHRLKKTPIRSRQQDSGKIKIVHYGSGNLVSPVVQDILDTELTGTTCVLVTKNKEALQITGLLLKNQLNAKLIQSNDGFNLYDLAEVRFFLSCLDLGDGVFVISDEVWYSAKRKLKEKYFKSTKFAVCRNIINDFEAANPIRKYKSDFEDFIRESRLEDFFGENGEAIFVSTIHKAKGKEFDNVFLMLENFNPSTDDSKRVLYVALTRAKQNLTVHLNSNYLHNILVENMERIEDREAHLPPDELVMHLTLNDVWLDYFIQRQYLVKKLVSGDELYLKGYECVNSEGHLV